MGIAMGGKGFKPGDKKLQQKPTQVAVRRAEEAVGKAPPRHKGKLAFRNIAPTNETERQRDIELTMQNIVFKYTRKEEMRSARYDSGEDEEDFFSSGVMGR